MKNLVFLILFAQLLFVTAEALEFEKISLSGFDKKILSEKQIRFAQKSGMKIHIQVEMSDPALLWKADTLAKDVEAMMEKRRTIYKVFGFKDIKLDNYKLGKNPQGKNSLSLFGSYKKLNDKTVYFAERNIYLNKNFIQIKILDEKKLPVEKFVDQIESELQIDKLEIE